MVLFKPMHPLQAQGVTFILIYVNFCTVFIMDSLQV